MTSACAAIEIAFGAEVALRRALGENLDDEHRFRRVAPRRRSAGGRARLDDDIRLHAIG
jgi:hypothetical protein